jgi:hypothetical protein
MEKRKQYQKPELKEVKLLPDEAVLAFCKGAGTARGTRRCRTVGRCQNNRFGS